MTRAGFVMSSQASSAGRDEAKVRQKLVETGDTELMIAIRSNFFGSVQESDGPRDFSGVGFPAKTGTVVVVAVGMWKPAFGAGFKAPWDERQLSVKILPQGPRSVISTANPAILPILCKCRRRNDAEDENPCLSESRVVCTFFQILVQSHFFYPRTVPCELWFLNRSKPVEHKDKVLMLDARNIFRKVTRKIYDFSPEQLQNILAVVWLYRGESQRFLKLVHHYLDCTLAEARRCFEIKDKPEIGVNLLAEFSSSLQTIRKAVDPFLQSLPKDAAHSDAVREVDQGSRAFESDVEEFKNSIDKEAKLWSKPHENAKTLNDATARMAVLGGASRDLVKQADLLYKLVVRLVEVCEKDLDASENELWIEVLAMSVQHITFRAKWLMPSRGHSTPGGGRLLQRAADFVRDCSYCFVLHLLIDQLDESGDALLLCDNITVTTFS